jgi:hypothetical protein
MRWDGTTWLPLGGLVYGIIHSALVHEGHLIVSGTVRADTIGSTVASMVASWDGTTWTQLTSFAPYSPIAVVDGELIAVSDGNVSSWNGTFWTPLPAQPLFVPECFTVFQGRLIAAGPRTTGMHDVASWNGVTWKTMSDVNAQNSTSVLCAAGGHLYSLRQDDHWVYEWGGTAWQIAGPTNFGYDGVPYCLGSDGTSLYVGGMFHASGGVATNCIARFDGTHFSAIGSGMDGGVSAIIDDSGGTMIGGGFTTIGGIDANRAVLQSVSGWEPRSFPVQGVSIRAFTKYNGAVVTAMYPGSSIPIAAWTGSQWQALGSGIPSSATISSIAEYNGELFAAGVIPSSFTGSPNIIRWNGTNWIAAGPGIPNTVGALCVYNGTLLASTSNNPVALPGTLFAWDGSTWVPYGGVGGQRIGVLGVCNNQLVATGYFSVPGAGNASIATYDAATSAWTVLAPASNSITIYSLASFRGDLYVGGYFSAIAAGVPAANIARWDGAWHALGQGLDGAPLAMLVTNDRLLVGGNFALAGGQVAYGLTTWVFPSADFNHDGDVGTDADIDAFFACLAGNCCTTCSSADFDGNGDTGTDADIEAYFRVLAGGGC